MTDVAKYSTAGKIRSVIVGNKALLSCPDVGSPPYDPKQLPKLDVIAHQMSQINCYNGNTIEPYPLAQHAVLVGYIVKKCFKEEWELAALLSFVPQVIYGNISHGIRNSIGMALMRFEEDVDVCVYKYFLERFGFAVPFPKDMADAISKASILSYLYAAQCLMPDGAKPQQIPEHYPAKPVLDTDIIFDDKLVVLDRHKAKAAFMERVQDCVAKLKAAKK